MVYKRNCARNVKGSEHGSKTREHLHSPHCFQLTDSLCVLVRGNYLFRSPLPGRAQLHSGADGALLVSGAGLGNERWSVTLTMNKHESPHLHEAGDCKISQSKL